MDVDPLRLVTPRLVIAPLAETDVDEFVAYRRDPDVARWQSWSTDYGRDDALDLVRSQAGWRLPPPGEWMQLGIRSRPEALGGLGGLGDGLLGDLALHALDDQPDTWELGFTLAPAAQGAGIATEAADALVDHLVGEAGAHRIVAECDARNTASSALLARLGFRREALHVEADWFKGEWTSVEVWALLRREWGGSLHPTHSPTAE